MEKYTLDELMKEVYRRSLYNAEQSQKALDETMSEKMELQERIDKAIEYFKYQLEQLDFYEDTKARLLCAMAIVMLEGEDKDK